MPVLSTLHKALETGTAYLPTNSEIVYSGPFEMSEAALKNTLTYVFEYLMHQCYMLCVKNGTHKLYKLMPRATAPLYKTAIATSLKRLKLNPTLTDAQRSFIARGVDGAAPIRVMQCIVKKFAPESADDVGDNEYLDVLRPADLPNGVFLFNLTDAVILRADGTHPFPMVVGPNVSIGKFGNSKHIPIFSISGQLGYLDIPIPNYDDVLWALGKGARLSDFTTEWNKKTVSQAVFRGGPTGCGYTESTNARIKIATMRSPLLDAGITVAGSAKTIDSRSIKFDPVYGLGVLNTGIRPIPRMSMVEQSRRKYIVHIDGNVSAYRLATTLATGSLILRVASDYTSWLDEHLRAGEHYIAIDADLSNLIETIEWCRAHDEECARIAARGREVAMWSMADGRVCMEIQMALWRLYSPAKKSSSTEVSVPIDTLTAASEKCAAGTQKTRIAGRRMCKLKEV